MAFQAPANFYELQPGFQVAREVPDASWNKPQAREDMRQLLWSNAQESVNSGKVAMHQVLQSREEPTMIQKMEAYACMDDLRGHMETMDAELAKTREASHSCKSDNSTTPSAHWHAPHFCARERTAEEGSWKVAESTASIERNLHRMLRILDTIYEGALIVER